MLEMRNVSNISSQCFGYHISEIVSDIRKAFGFVMTLPLTEIVEPVLLSVQRTLEVQKFVVSAACPMGHAGLTRDRD